jgi:beta-glucosidase
MLVSHGRAVEAIRSVHAEALVGIALDCRPSVPADDASVAANRHFDGFRNRWFFDPVFGMGYPEDMVEAYTRRGRLPQDLVWEGDMEEIAAPIDFLGLNYYTTVEISEGQEESDEPEGEPGTNPPEGFTEMGWRNDPKGLHDYLSAVHSTYAPRSIVVTENGASYSTGPGPDGKIVDDLRIQYLDRHVAAVLGARDEGVPVDGYFVWSLLDNLEWVEGFSQRFGLVWVDHDSGGRIPKQSFHWYRDLISSQRG